jgi:hypothetical protein
LRGGYEDIFVYFYILLVRIVFAFFYILLLLYFFGFLTFCYGVFVVQSVGR